MNDQMLFFSETMHAQCKDNQVWLTKFLVAQKEGFAKQLGLTSPHVFSAFESELSWTP